MRGTAARGGALFTQHDLPVVREYVEAVKATGARVHVTSRWINAVSAYATRDQLDEVAKLSFVTKLQPVARAARVLPPDQDQTAKEKPLLPPSSPRGDSRVDYGASQAQLAQMNLIALHEQGFTGDGVIIGMLDSGFKTTHEAYNDPLHPLNVIASYDFVNDDPNVGPEAGDPSTQHNHGTQTLSCIGAYKVGSLVGGAYDASFVLAKTEDTSDEYPAEEDNYVAGLEFIEEHGADMETSSLGYIDWYTQDDLDGLTAVTTIAVNISTSLGIHHCNSAGNEYHDSDPSTSSIIAPSDGFDVIAVGAVTSSGSISYFSSDGPTADGRVKPEVLALGSGAATVSPSSDTGYTSADGTSFSAPLVAAAVGCLVQANPHWTVQEMREHLFYTSDYYVAHGTFDPQYVRGYGIINAFAAWADCNLNEIADECDIDCGVAGGPCDVPGCGGSLDCNLNGVPDECEADCNDNGIPDDCDIADCTPGDPLCADCNGNGIPDECDIPFPQQGRVLLDRPRYACESVAVIQVDDCGLNLDGGVVETVSVTITSDSEPGGETVLLTETGTASTVFEGSISLSGTDSAGVLLVAPGDAVTVSYLDADDGLGGTDVVVAENALVDCDGPIISFVRTTDVGPYSANVEFQVDESSTATVRYGFTCGGLNEQVPSGGFATTFQIPLVDLEKNTLYFFAVDAEDQAGNLTTDNAGGACYSFTTTDIPDFFTEQFTGGFDLDGLTISFTPDGSGDFYAGCAEGNTGLPTDPAGGTTLSFSPSNDDGYAAISLTGGATVSLYGTSYSSLYVGSNGYLTFGDSDDDHNETLEEHFAIPRVAGLYNDLDPSDGGSVSWKQLVDRVAVTWQSVPEWNTSNSNTFQIELFFDGTIAVSYAGIAASEGIVGLSEGEGLSAEFYATDLSDMGACVPFADCDNDGDTDEDDYAVMCACFSGSGGGVDSGCRCVNYDGDNDVDCKDWNQFAALWTEGDPPVFPPCESIEADAIGGRYLAVTPSEGTEPVALLLTGGASEPAVSCLARYVQADGTLGDDPVFRLPMEWGTVFVSGAEIGPDTPYAVQGDYGTPGNPVLTPAQPVRTRLWADIDGNLIVNLADIQILVLAFQGTTGLADFEAMDLAGCELDGTINMTDVQWAVLAFQGKAYWDVQCAAPCP